MTGSPTTVQQPLDQLSFSGEGLLLEVDQRQACADRDWAPPGGTSLARFHQLHDALDATFRAALAEALAGVPQLTGRHLDRRGPDARGGGHAWLLADGESGCYAVAAGLEHRAGWCEAGQRTCLTVHHLTEPTADERPRTTTLLELRLTGPSAREAHLLAALVLTTVTRHLADAREDRP